MDTSKKWTFLALGVGALYAFTKYKENPLEGTEKIKAATKNTIHNTLDNIEMNPFLRSHIKGKASDFTNKVIDDKIGMKDVTPQEVKDKWEKTNT